jgi:hypothetical protein
MLVFGVLVFSVVTFFLSFLIGRTRDFDRSKIASYVSIIAWSSLLFGMYIARMMP